MFAEKLLGWFKKTNNDSIVQQVGNNMSSGWSNIFTGLGAANSRVNNVKYAPGIRLDERTLTEIYHGDRIARRIVDMLVEDATREFIKCDGDLLKELKRINTEENISQGCKWARLYGGGMIVAFVDDGQELDKPLNIKRIRKLVRLEVYDRWQIGWQTDETVKDYYSEHYGEPEIYTIRRFSGESFRVHRSRCHIFNGDLVCNSIKIRNQGWNDSILQGVYQDLRNYRSIVGCSAEIVQDFIQTIISVNGLTDMISAGNEDMVNERMNLMDISRSVMNMIFLDAKDEQYSKESSSVAGLSDIRTGSVEDLCAASSYPITRLFGTSPGGLNSTGEHDVGNYYDVVQAYRTSQVEPVINWLLEMIEAQSMWIGKKPESYEWTFPALKTPNDQEKAEIKHKTAQTDQIYINCGAVDPAYLFKLRYADGEFNSEIVIDPDYMDKLAEEDKLEILPDNADLVSIPASQAVNRDSDELIQARRNLESKLLNIINKVS